MNQNINWLFFCWLTNRFIPNEFINWWLFSFFVCKGALSPQMKWNIGSLLVSPVGNIQLFTVKSKHPSLFSFCHICSCAVVELLNMEPLFSDGWTLWPTSTHKILNTWTFVTQRGGFSAVKPKRFSVSRLLFEMSLMMLAYLGQSLTEKKIPLLTGGGQPALHHGLPEGELAEARPVGSKLREPAPWLPSLWHRARPWERRGGNGGENVIQAPRLPGTLAQYGKSERHQLETAVQHYRVQTEELPWQRSWRRHHRLKRFLRTY